MKEINYNTELRHFAYPSINQFRNVIKNVQHTARFIGLGENDEPLYDSSKPLPILNAVGTTKLHGTNAAIVLDYDNNVVYFQSRESVITPLKDNAGFAGYMASIQQDILDMVFADTPCGQLIIFGEWCGGNIQKGVAISGLDKMFVIFDVRHHMTTDDGRDLYEWFEPKFVQDFKIPSKRIHNIYDFRVWELEIDFNKPELAQGKLQEITEEIEAQCPVGAHFGNDGIGEGAVWKLVDEAGKYNDSGFWMKVKGEKHSASKVKTLASVDVEKISSLREFAESTVTDSRCEQSIQKLREAGIHEISRSHLGEFIRWIHADIVKEELDTIQENGLTVKEIGSYVAQLARNWFFTHELEF